MRAEIELDAFMIMPNHIHGIVFIHPVGARGFAPETVPPNLSDRHTPLGFAKQSLSSFVLGFKSAVTSQINTLRRTKRRPFWQRNYYEHVIRDEKELHSIREYIRYNPLKWDEDEENPNR